MQNSAGPYAEHSFKQRNQYCILANGVDTSEWCINSTNVLQLLSEQTSSAGDFCGFSYKPSETESDTS